MVSDFLVRLGNSLIIILLSKYISSSATGSFSLALTFFYIGSVISYWGFGNLLIREVAKSKDFFNKAFVNFGLSRLAFSLTTSMIIIIFSFNVNIYSSETRSIIQIIALLIPIDSISALCQSAFIAFEKIKFTSIVSLISNFIKILLGFFLITRVDKPLINLAFLYLFVGLITLILYLIFIRRFLTPLVYIFDFKFCFSQFKIAFPFFIMAIFLAIDNRIEIIILSFFVTDNKIGYYSAMNTILGAMFLFPEAIRNSVFPIFARYAGHDPEHLQEEFKRLIKFILIITIPIVIMSYIFAEDLVVLLFSNEFLETVYIFRIAVFSFISYSLINVFSRLLIVYNLEKFIIISLSLSALITIISNIIFIPRFGLSGVAVVKTVTSIILLISYIVISNKRIFEICFIKQNWRIGFAGTVMAIIALFTTQNDKILQLGLSLFSYFILLFYLKVFSEKDISMVKNIFYSYFP